MATIQDGDGQHIQQGEVDVHEYAEPKRQAPALLAGKQPGINIHDFHRPTQMLHFDIGVPCKEGAESIKHGIDTCIDLFDSAGMRERHFAIAIPEDADPRLLAGRTDRFLRS